MASTYARISCLFGFFGDSDYIGEPVSIKEHSLQAAALAYSTNSEDTEIVIAALLHDIGHALGLEAGEPIRMGGCGIINHELLGGEFVKMLGFSERVARLISRHVSAKRYLCFKHQEYYDKLSGASKTTLGFQGGPMGAKEAGIYENDPDFESYLIMRRWDEAAKIPSNEISVPSLEFYRELFEDHLRMQATFSSDTFKFLHPYLLSKSQLDFYNENNYLKISNFFAYESLQVASLKLWVKEISDLTETLHKSDISKSVFDAETYGSAFPLTQAELQSLIVHYELSGASTSSSRDNDSVDHGRKKQICRVENFLKFHDNMRRMCLERILPIVSQLFKEVREFVSVALLN